MSWYLLILISIGAGVIQTVTGFGGGIVLMLFLPHYYSMLQAPAISASIAAGLTVILAWQFRKHAQYRLIILPGILCAVTSTIAINVAKYIDAEHLKTGFALFLIVLSIYLFFFSSKVQLRPNLPTICFCTVISGVLSGFFGIGGPLMALLFISISDTKEHYIGNLQTVFCFINLVNMTTRVIKGIYVASFIPITLLGIVGILLGKRIGLKILNYIDTALVKKLVYAFICISGISMLIPHT